MRNQDRGFSLVEIAVVIVIIGFLFVLIVPSITGRVKAARLEGTKAKEEVIKGGLIAFVARNNRLPCPAIEGLGPGSSENGKEAPDLGVCTGATTLAGGAVRGAIPWLALGLTEEISLDAYGQRFTYVVTTDQTNLTANTVSGMLGNIPVHSAAPIASGNQVNVKNLAVVIVISHGATGAGAFSTEGTQLPLPAAANIDELENTDVANNAFVQRGISEGTIVFDDIVMPITPSDILAGLEKSGVKPAAGAINEKFSAIRNALLGFLVGDVTDPDGPGLRTRAHRLPAADTDGDGTANLSASDGTVPYLSVGLTLIQATDPWGRPIRYTAGNASLVVGAPLATAGFYTGMTATGGFTLRSYGPNGIAGDSDDFIFEISAPEIRGILASAQMPD